MREWKSKEESGVTQEKGKYRKKERHTKKIIEREINAVKKKERYKERNNERKKESEKERKK